MREAPAGTCLRGLRVALCSPGDIAPFGKERKRVDQARICSLDETGDRSRAAIDTSFVFYSETDIVAYHLIDDVLVWT